MRKLVFTLCLIMLCIVTFSSRVHAVFITDIDEFKQDNTSGGTNTFTDSFDLGTEPPDGPSGPSTYVIEGLGFDPGDEDHTLGGSLELDSDDGIVDVDEKIIGAAVRDSNYFFIPTTAGQYVEGWFDFSGGGLPSDSFFGIGILNFASDGNGDISGDPATDDEAWMEVILDDISGHLVGAWGDETQDEPRGTVDLGLVGSTIIGIKLEIDSATDKVTAFFNYGTGHTETDFTTLGFNTTTGDFYDIYTGAFYAGESVPEPTTIALLGIGLVGLAGAAARRRFKKTVNI